MPRWDLVYKWADPETQSLVDAVTSALENCDQKLEALATPAPASSGLDVDEDWLRLVSLAIVAAGRHDHCHPDDVEPWVVLQRAIARPRDTGAER